MKIGPDGMPILGTYSKDTALIGYFCVPGTKFLKELSIAVGFISDSFSRHDVKLEDMGYSGEIDFLAKELTVRWEIINDIKLGKLNLLWMHPVMLNRLPQDTFSRLEELFKNKLLREGNGIEMPSFEGRSLQQRIDIIASDLRTGQDHFASFSIEDFLSVLKSDQENVSEKHVFVPYNLIANFEKSDEEFAAFERFRLSRIAKRFMEDGDFEIVQGLASRVAEEVGYLEVLTYAFNSAIRDFSMIVHRYIRLSDGIEIKTEFTPDEIRDRKYKKLSSSMVELMKN
jgi:hypothetical protein